LNGEARPTPISAPFLTRRGGWPYQLGRIQQRDEPDDWKPMSIVGAGTIEIRIRVGTAHRVFVVTKFEEAIYVLHAFEKKSQKTPKSDIDLAKHRYGELTAQRSRK
jgi:phage-related protein